ncbi:MAG: class I SAM-dependent rRNA methyltransferase [Candidatus Omnitrophica bacterium]|nr:class I SAM-dependent rRNA methyltransferase [Candidatus Omnitrophota bacterium]MDD5737928.1 class I SAM-dependent rRNA methyltransferase [Candidatus Omnitrophota bacterium]
MDNASVKLTRKGAAWNRTGHPWVYRDDIEKCDLSELSGGIVSVEDYRGKFLGKAFFNAKSKIALRIITGEDVPVDAAFWRNRISESIAARSGITDADAYRLAHSEADGLPSLIVDNYAGHLSVQTLCLGMDRIKRQISETLAGLLKPKSIIERNDSATRKLEGMEESKGTLYGEPPAGGIEVREGKIKYTVDIMNGQKTGAYLDQRENHIAAERYSRGSVLDCFSYQGLFSLHAALGADDVTAVDSSGQALGKLKENAALNGIGNISVREGKVPEALRAYQAEGRQFDLIILDPPAYAKSKKDLQAAARGYIDINFRAMKLLKKGGHLMTCSCSYNLSEGQFMDIIDESLWESRRRAKLVEKRIQPRDHPILLNFPESNYLKCFVLEML